MKKIIITLLLVSSIIFPSASLASIQLDNNTDYIQIANNSTTTDLNPYTFWGWVYFDSFEVSLRRFIRKTGTSGFFAAPEGGSGVFRFVQVRSGGNARYDIAMSAFTAGKWIFFAWVYDSSAGAGEIMNIYLGDLTTIPAEATYAATTDSSGTSTGQTNAIYIGRDQDTNAGVLAKIATIGLVNRALTVGEIKSLWMRPRKVEGTVLFSHYGFAADASATQPDWSGNANTGTNNGGVQAVHVPLSALVY